MKKTERTIRLSQVVSNFGIGAIYDILGESLVLKDTQQWRGTLGRGREINAARLVNHLTAGGLNVKKLYEPATSADYAASTGGSLPYMRFPRWLFCSKCRRMLLWKPEMEQTGKPPVCPHCSNGPRLTPMRFIMICDHGHMSDIDWIKWAHSQTVNDRQKSCKAEDLEFLTGYTKTGGLESVAVSCRKCGAARDLGTLTLPPALGSAGIYCSGKQPWESFSSHSCRRTAHAVQRGAGNVYYPIIKSAITIPPESRFTLAPGAPGLIDEIRTSQLFSLLTAPGATEDFNKIVISKICDQYHCNPELVLQALHGDSASDAGDKFSSDIELEEWTALITENPEADDRDKFVTKHFKGTSRDAMKTLNLLIDHVVSVVKLREVRALTGFYRYQPGGDEDNKTSKPVLPDLGKGSDWLPALEVYGEGIFISVDETRLAAWENRPEIISRVKTLRERTVNSSYERLLPDVTPRYVMLHTMAHLLIRRLAFECGYSSASLRERIYSRTGSAKGALAGILIYTAAGDSEGTLGGLSRQCSPDKLFMILISALQDAANCSADPICMESTGQGLDAMNLAACHACSLVAETSCTSFNLLLDRALIVGDGHINGFFEDILKEFLEVTILNEQ
jgi:hypothetical protein